MPLVIGVAAVIIVLIGIGAAAMTRPAVRTRARGQYDRAFGWIDDAIAAWQAEGRLTPGEADRLRAELREPDFVAVLPHFGVHLAIGMVLRFPIGSITRAVYVLANMGLTHLRLVTRRIDARTFRRLMGIHSPLVLLITCLPGIGTFAYLASKPFRAHHLLVRVALDAVLLKLPKGIYQRSGARPIVARPPRRAADAPEPAATPGLQLRIVPALAVAALGAITVGLFAADVAVELIDELFAPGFLGWKPIARILDLNAESSIGTWFATTMLLLCAVLLGIIALGKREARDRFARHWAGLAVIVLGLAVDEQAKLHDLGSGFGGEMRERLGLGGVLYYGWVIVAAATVVVLAVVYWRFVFALPASTRARFIVAGALYLAGEMGVEMAGGWVIDRDGATLTYALMTSVEEFLGMLGVLVAIGTLLGELRTAGPVSVTVAAPDGGMAAPDVTGIVIQPARDASRRAQAPVSTVQTRP
jgi:hypothetical protein